MTNYNASLANAALWQEPPIDQATNLFLLDPSVEHVNLESQYQYRNKIEPEDIEEKAEEFKKFAAIGEIPPTMIFVCKSTIFPYTWDIVYGAIRCAGAKMAGCKIWAQDGTNLEEKLLQRIAVSENLLRKDPNELEMTEGILRLVSLETGLDQEGIKKLLSWNHNGRRNDVVPNSLEAWAKLESVLRSLPRPIQPATFYKKYLPLLSLPAALDKAVRDGVLDYSKALELRRMPEDKLEAAIATVIENGLPVAQVKELIQRAIAPTKPPRPYQPIASQLGKLRPDSLPPEKQQELESLLEQIRRLLDAGH